jgi:hypothetical protein
MEEYWVKLGNVPESLLISGDEKRFFCRLCDVSRAHPNTMEKMETHHRSASHQRQLLHDDTPYEDTSAHWVSALGNPAGSICFTNESSCYKCLVCNDDRERTNTIQAMNAHAKSEKHVSAISALQFHTQQEEVMAQIMQEVATQPVPREAPSDIDIVNYWVSLGNTRDSIHIVGEGKTYKCGLCNNGREYSTRPPAMSLHCSTHAGVSKQSSDNLDRYLRHWVSLGNDPDTFVFMPEQRQFCCTLCDAKKPLSLKRKRDITSHARRDGHIARLKRDRPDKDKEEEDDVPPRERMVHENSPVPPPRKRVSPSPLPAHEALPASERKGVFDQILEKYFASQQGMLQLDSVMGSAPVQELLSTCVVNFLVARGNVQNK